MAKSEKVLRVNFPYRILPDTLEKLRMIAAEDLREPGNMMEKMVDEKFKELGLTLPGDESSMGSLPILGGGR